MGTALGEVLSDLITPISRSRHELKECQSTEEMISHIHAANKLLDEGQCTEAMVGSMDVEAFYLSIHQKKGARIVSEEIIRSDVIYEGVNIRKAAVYHQQQ